MRIAAKFVKWTFDNLVNEIEDIIEIEKQVKHETISKKVENMIEDEKKLEKFLKANPGVDSTFLEYPLSVLVQSGENFTLNKLNVQSDSNKLNHETIYLNVCGKYKDMNVMAGRTLIVNPQDDQKKAYNIAFEAVDVVIKNLIVG
jgi:nucleosome binding factor SPN SPT16 subunit